MVDSIGASTGQILSALTGAKDTGSAQSKQGRTMLNDASSPDTVDEVSISNEAMDIGRVMEIVQEAKEHVKNEPQLTLSNDIERLNMLV